MFQAVNGVEPFPFRCRRRMRRRSRLSGGGDGKLWSGRLASGDADADTDTELRSASTQQIFKMGRRHWFRKPVWQSQSGQRVMKSGEDASNRVKMLHANPAGVASSY